MRFGQLVFRLPEISRKVLTEQLRELEEDGLVSREMFHEIPRRVEYSLTEKTQRLLPIFRAMNDWIVNEEPDVTYEECWIYSHMARCFNDMGAAAWELHR